MSADDLRALRELETQFASAMTQMYAVGNGLARLRTQVEGSATVTQAAPIPGAAAPVAPAPVPSDAATAAATASRALPAAPSAAGQPPQPPAQPGAFVAPGTPARLPQTPPLVSSGPLARPPQPPPPAGTYLPAQPWWQREGMVTRVLGIAGAIITLAGVAMLLILAVQQRWFGPAPRVVLGVLLAIGLIVAAFRVRAGEQRAGRPGAGALALAATGYAVAYLDVVAVTTIYGWVPPLPGLVLAGLVVASGLLLARLWDSELLATILLLGAAVLAPVIAGELSWVLSAFMVVLALASWPAQLGRHWRVAGAARLGPTILVLLLGTGGVIFTDEPMSVRWGHVGVALALALGTLAFAILEARTDDTPLPGVAVIAATIPVLAAATLLPRLPRSLVPAALAIVLAGVTVTLLRRVGTLGQRWLASSTALAGTLALLAAIIMLDLRSWLSVALLVTALGYVATALATRHPLPTWLSVGMSMVAVLVWAPAPLAVAFQRQPPWSRLSENLLSSVLVGVLVVLLTMLWQRSTRTGTSGRHLWALALWVLALTTIATITVTLGQIIGTRLGEPTAGFLGGHAAATIAWMGAAVWLLLRGLRRITDRTLSLRLALAIAAVAVGKLFLYDLASLSGISRVLAFIVTGLLLLWTGSSYAKALERASSGVPEEGAGTGHAGSASDQRPTA